MAEPTVRMSGIVLASLMFQHVNSESDVEGFILGESKFEEQVTINDSQADHIHIEETYNIQKHVACHQLNSFYNSVGAVDVEAVKRLLADNKQERVIGWYRQRRNSEQVMSLREKVVHENLKAALSNPHVVFVLLTPSKMTSPGSTHRTEYAAFISRSRTFLNVPVLVNNLGLLEQLSYWKVSAPCSSAGYNLTMKKHGSKFFSSNGLLREVNEVNKMNESLQVELQKTCRDVEESEREVETLQVEVAALRSRVREKRRSQKGVKQEEDDDGPKKKNLLLQEAVRALFSCSSLFHSQTLTLNAFPVPAVCCGAERRDEDVEDDEGEDVVSVLDAVKPQERLSRMNFRKRLSEATEQRERKRRKNQNC